MTVRRRFGATGLRIAALASAALLATGAAAGDEVAPGSSGHRFEVRVGNPSDLATIARPALKAISYPGWVLPPRISGGAGGLGPGEETRFVVTFDVTADAPPGASGDLVLEVVAEAGVYPEIREIRVPLRVREAPAALVYLLESIRVPDDAEHQAGVLGFSRRRLQRDGELVELDAIACTRCPQRIRLGEPFEIAAVGWKRYDFSLYRCSDGLSGHPAGFGVGGDLGRARVSGTPLQGPACGQAALGPSGSGPLVLEDRVELAARYRLDRIEDDGSDVVTYVYRVDVDAEKGRLIGEPARELGVRIQYSIYGRRLEDVMTPRLSLHLGGMQIGYRLDRGGDRPLATAAFVLPPAGRRPPPRPDEPVLDLDELVGLPLRDAMARLSNAGLVGRPVLGSVAPSAEKNGRVEAASAEASPLVRGGRVQVTVYREAVESAVVPDLVGTTIPLARSRAESRGLGIREQAHAPAASPSDVGKVARQDPPPGTEVRPGSEVVVAVWGEPAMAPPPPPSPPTRATPPPPPAAGGVPFIELPARVGSSPLAGVQLPCTQDFAEPLRRVERPPGGFKCSASSARSLVVRFSPPPGVRSNLGIRVYLSWFEPGDDLRAAEHFCGGHRGGTLDELGIQTTVLEPDRAYVKLTLAFVPHAYRGVPGVDLDYESDEIDAFMEAILRQIEPYAAPCR